MLNNSTRNNIKNTQKKANTVATERRDRLLQESVPFIMAEITDHSALPGTTNRWLYTWVCANIGTTSAYLFSSGAELWYKGNALNVIEAANSASFVGPGIVLANIPAGFTVKPIEGFVLLYPGRRTNGTPIWLFCVPNAIDGVCI
jgi:hypothetical protein